MIDTERQTQKYDAKTFWNKIEDLIDTTFYTSFGYTYTDSLYIFASATLADKKATAEEISVEEIVREFLEKAKNQFEFTLRNILDCVTFDKPNNGNIFKTLLSYAEFILRPDFSKVPLLKSPISVFLRNDTRGMISSGVLQKISFPSENIDQLIVNDLLSIDVQNQDSELIAEFLSGWINQNMTIQFEKLEQKWDETVEECVKLVLGKNYGIV